MKPTNQKAIRVFESIQDMEDDRYRQAAAMDPVEGLRQTVELILRAYRTSREELKRRPPNNIVIITRKG